jgi:hypothetical protein
MKKIVILVLLLMLVGSLSVYASEREKPPGFLFVIGPRIGATYWMASSEEFTDLVNPLFPLPPDKLYYPVNTIFGINFEQRVLLGNTRSHFVFQELVIVGGLEQAIALPVGALLIGYRGAHGLEFGIGPMASLAGIGVVGALGWTFSISGVFVPFDVFFVFPNSTRPPLIGISTGFNFAIRKKKN